jgi:protein TonB
MTFVRKLPLIVFIAAISVCAGATKLAVALEQPAPHPTESSHAVIDPAVSEQHRLEAPRLETPVERDWEIYPKGPRRKFIGSRTQEYVFARYVDNWQMKIERVGELNYPEAARSGKLHGSLVLTVAIKADGSLESIEVNRPSGHKVLDDAAVQIVRLASPFEPFTAGMRSQVDILHITRTWTFIHTDRLDAK